MKNSSFIQTLRSEISNDELCDLLRTFEPLLKKYARLLEYPDAYFDLQAAFLDIVKKLDVNRLDNKTDGTVFRYIQSAVHHQYISLSKARRQYVRTHVLFCELEDPETGLTCLSNVLADTPAEDELSFIEKDYLQRHLNKTEYEIILLIFYCGYSIAEIAQSRKVSRQYVNRQKISALQKLKSALLESA